MCTWDRYCSYAREPAFRDVAIDCRITVAGVTYEVDPDLAGETVQVWWGLLDDELFVEHREERYGPYHPIGGPVPLHRYRLHRDTKHQKRIGEIETLAKQLKLPRAALEGDGAVVALSPPVEVVTQPFVGPDPFNQDAFPSPLSAKRAISEAIGMALAKLSPEARAFIDALLTETLDRRDVIARVRARLRDDHAQRGF